MPLPQMCVVTGTFFSRAAEEVQLYSSECIPLSHDTLENAIQWMWGLDRLAPVSNTACAEAVLRAMMDSHVSQSFVCLSACLPICLSVCPRNSWHIHLVSMGCPETVRAPVSSLAAVFRCDGKSLSVMFLGPVSLMLLL